MAATVLCILGSCQIIVFMLLYMAVYTVVQCCLVCIFVYLCSGLVEGNSVFLKVLTGVYW